MKSRQGKCKFCGGKGYIYDTCSDCWGSGNVADLKKYRSEELDLDASFICPTCQGYGFIKKVCFLCNGSGVDIFKK